MQIQKVAKQSDESLSQIGCQVICTVSSRLPTQATGHNPLISLIE